MAEGECVEAHNLMLYVILLRISETTQKVAEIQHS